MKRRINCVSCGIIFDQDSRYCKYCGTKRDDIPDDYIEESGLEASAGKRIRYCKYCGKRLVKSEPCNCADAVAETKRLENEAKKAKAKEEKLAKKQKKEEKQEISKEEIIVLPEMIVSEEEIKAPPAEVIIQKQRKPEELVADTEYIVTHTVITPSSEIQADRISNGKQVQDYEESYQGSARSGSKGKRVLLILAGVILIGTAALMASLLSEDKESKQSAPKTTTDETMQETQNFAEGEPEIVIISESQSESEARRIAESESESEAKRIIAESESESEAKRIAESESESEAKRIAESESESEAKRIAESESESEAKRIAELESETEVTPVKLIYGYEGSYIAKSGILPFCTVQVSSERTISFPITEDTILYVEIVKEEDGQKLGYVNYGGMEGLINMDEFTRISMEDYSIQESTLCFVNNQSAEGISLFYESDIESDVIGQIPYGTELSVERQENTMGYVTYNGRSGWILMDQITPFYSELAYQSVAGSSGYLSMKSQPNDNSVEMAAIPNGVLLLVDDLQNGWCKTAYDGMTGWICAANLKPVGDSSVMNFSILETPAAEVTIIGDTTLYKDGTSVPDYAYIMAESATRLLTQSDLDKLTLKGLCYAKNEIYARYGRKFKSQELMDFFNGQTWYNGIYEPEAADSQIVASMNSYEKANKDMLWEEEQRRGTYTLDAGNKSADVQSVAEAQVVSTEKNDGWEEGIHSYRIYLADITWEEAYRECIKAGGHLVCFETLEEYEYILDVLQDGGYEKNRFYIGSRRELDSKKYYWVDDTNTLIGKQLNDTGRWTENAWMNGEPSYKDETINQTEHVVEIFYYSDEGRWVWNDIPNNLPEYISEGKLGYICEYE